MARTEVPTGDQIAQQVKSKTAESSLVDIARELTDAHNHRPGLFNQDLAKVNQALHDQGILPGIDIVGVNGQDFVGKKSDGSTVVIDSSDVSRTHDGPSGSVLCINGRIASRNSDGSGTVVVGKGDSAWTISRDVLKSQGITSPTDNQIANYTKELEQLNGKDKMAHLQPGKPIDLPPANKDSFDTQFTDDRANAQKDKTIKEVTDNIDAAKAAVGLTNWHGIDFGGGVSKERLQGLLDTKTDLTDQEKKGLNFLIDDYSLFEKHVKGGNGRSDQSWFDYDSLDKYQAMIIKSAEQDATQTRRDG